MELERLRPPCSAVRIGGAATFPIFSAGNRHEAEWVVLQVYPILTPIRITRIWSFRSQTLRFSGQERVSDDHCLSQQGCHGDLLWILVIRILVILQILAQWSPNSCAKNMGYPNSCAVDSRDTDWVHTPDPPHTRDKALRARVRG